MFRIDPVVAVSGGRVALAFRLACADLIAAQLKPKPATYADGMPEE